MMIKNKQSVITTPSEWVVGMAQKSVNIYIKQITTAARLQMFTPSKQTIARVYSSFVSILWPWESQ